jgi:DNA-directed RNA polymerase specialized sigma24 family protein
MSPSGSVSQLLSGLKAGDDAAAKVLWKRYCDRLVGLARRKLQKTAHRLATEEDVAQSAFNSLCLGAREGRFPALKERDALLGLLVFITAQKAADQIAYENRKKRKSPGLRGGSAIDGQDRSSRGGRGGHPLAPSPGPATLAIWAEEYERLLFRLGDDTLRQVAELSVQGYKIDEIAERLGLARRTIHRKLDLIRKVWMTELPSWR